MAVAGLQDIIDALADQIRTAMEAVTDVDVQVEPGWINNPTPPTIDVFQGRTPSRDTDSAGFGDISGGYWITVRARVPTGDSVATSLLLTAFGDDQNDLSVPNAILDDPTLNGNAATLDVRDFSGLVPYPDVGGEGSFVGCEWSVLVIAGES